MYLTYDEAQTNAEYIFNHTFMQGTWTGRKKMELECFSEMYFFATHADATVILQYILCFQATATDTLFHSIRTAPKKRTLQQLCPFYLRYNKYWKRSIYEFVYTNIRIRSSQPTSNTGTKNKYDLYRVIRNDCRGFNNFPPRSPDAIPRDFFTWGYVKVQIYVSPLPASIPELKVRIRTTTETITSDMLQTVWNGLDYRVDVYRITKGAHIENL